MRLIRALVPDDDRERAIDLMEEEGLDFVVTESAGSRDAAVIEFPLPTEGVDAVLDRFRDADLPIEEYTVIVDVAAAKTPGFADLEERFIEDDAEDDRVPREEVRATALNMHPGRLTYYAMTLLSVLVATAGLLLDSPALVVGSMVIAPQVVSALTASVGLTLGDRDMLLAGLRSQVLSLAAAVGGAFLFGLLLKSLRFVSPVLDVATIAQISSRTSPGLLIMVVAACAGAAGAFGLATDLPVSLVGVAVAAAIVPAAAAVGIGVAWAIPTVAFGALVLLVVNLVFINLAGSITLWSLGYRPEDWPSGGVGERGRAVLGSPTIPPASVLLVFALLGPGALMVDHLSFENDAKTAVQDLVDDPAYADLEVVSVRAALGGPGPLGSAQRVTVTVRRPADVPHPGLADRIERAIESRADEGVRVTVEFVERQRAGE
jgi:uncharacterized hydrophobic protein (TIGR00341 family)